MRLNMPEVMAAHQQLERTHLPTSFPPPTHSSRGRERGARCVWRVSTVHPHTQRQARERGSRERRAGTRLYVNHGIYATVSTCAATFDPLSTLRSGFWWCVASHNPRTGVWLFSHTPKKTLRRDTVRAPVVRGAAAACAAAAWVQYRDAPPASPAAARGAHRGTRARIIYVINTV